MRSLSLAAILSIAQAGVGFPMLSGQTPALSSRQPLRPALEVYDSYPTPGACASVLERLHMRSDWIGLASRERYDPARMPDSAARAGAARCLGQVLPGGVNVATEPYRSVAALFVLGRALGDDSMASRALTRGLHQQRLGYDSASVFWAATSAYAWGLPVRLRESQRMAASLDRLGVVGERMGLPQDSMWFSQHQSPLTLAQAIFDTAAVRAELEGVRRNYAAVPKSALHGTEYAALTMHSTELLLTLVLRPRDDSAVAALKAKALAILGPHQENGPFGGGMELLGEPFGPLHPDFWFNKNPADTLIPRKGRVTLVQYLRAQDCGWYSDGPVSASVCESMYATARRLKQKFGDALDLLILTQTSGHFDRQVQLEPADEARQIGRRLLEKDRLPATVAVYRTTFVANPDPDSRLVAQPIAELNRIRFAGSALLIDRRGVFVMAGSVSLGPYSERALEALITSLLTAPAT